MRVTIARAADGRARSSVPARTALRLSGVIIMLAAAVSRFVLQAQWPCAWIPSAAMAGAAVLIFVASLMGDGKGRDGEAVATGVMVVLLCVNAALELRVAGSRTCGHGKARGSSTLFHVFE